MRTEPYYANLTYLQGDLPYDPAKVHKSTLDRLPIPHNRRPYQPPLLQRVGLYRTPEDQRPTFPRDTLETTMLHLVRETTSYLGIYGPDPRDVADNKVWWWACIILPTSPWGSLTHCAGSPNLPAQVSLSLTLHGTASSCPVADVWRFSDPDSE